MTKVDLITGFLGSGKTTFIRKYTDYLISQGEKLCILENDFGAVNVDMMLLKDFESKNVDLEMVAGGCDSDCHRRRFKTKLIAMGMRGYDRVIIEPSGLFDTDEFFDCLYDEPLDSWYEIGNIISILDLDMNIPLSESASTCLSAELASSGIVLATKYSELFEDSFNKVINYSNELLRNHKVNRNLNDYILKKNLNDYSEEDFFRIKTCGYKRADYIRFNVDESGFMSLCYMNKAFSKDKVMDISNRIFNDILCGTVFRIKGFVNDENGWYQINFNPDKFTCDSIIDGQDVIIVIGENLNEKEIDKYFV